MDDALLQKQIEIEQESYDIYKQREALHLGKALSGGRADETARGRSLMKEMHEHLTKTFAEYLNTEELRGHTAKTQRFIDYLCDGKPDVLAYVVIQTVLKYVAQSKREVLASTLASAITKQLVVQASYAVAKENNPKLISYLSREFRRASARRKKELIDKHLKEFTTLVKDKSENSEMVRAGAFLLNLTAKALPDFITVKKEWGGRQQKSRYTVKLNEYVQEYLCSVPYLPPSSAVYPPMVVKPRAWTSFFEGGLISLSMPFVKVRGKGTANKYKVENLEPVMEIVNQLQKKAWRVNTRVSHIIHDIYEANFVDPRSPPKAPKLIGGLPLSSPLTIYDLVGKPKEGMSKDEWHLWNKEREKVKVYLDGETGRRIQYLFTMGMVEKMLDYDRFYYAYQLDYRGRVYPITDFFNPQSSKYVKAMLEFADGEYLDDVGEYWLKIHIANTYGMDKEELEDRIAWFDANESMVLEVAEKSLEVMEHWAYADSPYEFLAGCFAWQDYKQGKKVHLPIQLDAVNSGIQMYSGLLRDEVGAKATCVIGDTREDLYKQVAERVNEKLREGKYPPIISFMDKEGVERTVSTKVEANSMVGKINRSIVKRNVMTIPYSVTIQGMQQQNWDVMEELETKGKAFWEGDKWVVNKLLTLLTHEAVFEIVEGAREGQNYLKDVAKLHKEEVMWYSPIYKFPVFNFAPKYTEYRVSTVLGVLSMKKIVDNAINRYKMQNSIAPNYIHNIDSTILMWVVDRLNGDLGVVHDCFLVHPNKGDEVRDAYKEGYVEVMKSDPLRSFSRQLDEEGKVEIPYINTLDLDDVYKSKYIIS
ncbi:MAG: hypothetical protein GXO26_00685 [Crenarchaeota archaeon]|nr:hypothetical protein [Thermoproteota archaeon]